jgi:redox-sensing transcriptional repressor
MKKNISCLVLRRLAIYYRYLSQLPADTIHSISSNEISKQLGIKASQLRQDLHWFGEFGHQGYGYDIAYLKEQIRNILHLDIRHPFIIIGAGNLGQALANYAEFEHDGFILKALFDVNPKLIGLRIRDVEIMDMDNLEIFLSQHPVSIAAICTPANKAQSAINRVVNAGVKGIWNFACANISVPEGIVVENVYLNESLYTLAARLEEECDERAFNGQ